MAENDNRIQGIILDDEEISQAVEDLVEEVIVLIRLEGQSQLYAFDMSNKHTLISKIFEELDEEDMN